MVLVGERVELDNDDAALRLLREGVERIRLFGRARTGKDERVGTLGENGRQGEADAAAGAGDFATTRRRRGSVTRIWRAERRGRTEVDGRGRGHGD